MTEREKTEILDRLIAFLYGERGEAPPEIPEGRKEDAYRALVNVRPPAPVPAEFLRLQDKYLSELALRRGTVSVSSLAFRDGIAVWRGDITRLDADAIVNAGNPALLGCFRPLHNCIDNVIHSSAGVQVRADCAALTRGKEVRAGGVEVTSAYNLPSRYIFHTVGPCVAGAVTERDRAALASCYAACLERAVRLKLRSIVFPCVSTGVYGYPPEEAAAVAVRTVRDFLKDRDAGLRVVFDVFTDRDEAVYRELTKRTSSDSESLNPKNPPDEKVRSGRGFLFPKTGLPRVFRARSRFPYKSRILSRRIRKRVPSRIHRIFPSIKVSPQRYIARIGLPGRFGLDAADDPGYNRIIFLYTRLGWNGFL